MRAFIIMSIATIFGVALIFAGCIILGITIDIGWNPIPLAVAMIIVGSLQTLICGILAGVFYSEDVH